MMLILAACVTSTVLAPVTGVAGAMRAGTGDLGGAPGSDTSRLTIIDDTLNARVVQFVRARSGPSSQPAQAIVLDARGVASPMPIGTADQPGAVLALAPDWWVIDRSATIASLAAPAPARRAGGANGAGPNAGEDQAAWIDLVDGQRFIGRPGPAGDDEQLLRWIHPRLGTLSIELDSVARVQRRLNPDPAASPAPPSLLEAVRQDTVWLSNGDRFEGFIEGITAADDADAASGPALTITSSAPAGTPTSAKPAPFRVAFDQLASASFANAAAPIQPGLSRLWLGDGSVLHVEQLDIDATTGRVTISSATLPRDAADRPTGPAASLELNQLRAVAFDGSRLHALARQPIAAHGPLDGRRIAPPPRVVSIINDGPAPLNADDIVLPGPMFVEWTLPPGAVRIAGWATLDPAASAWGDCEFRMSISAAGGETREVTQGRVHVEAPAMPINVAIPPSSSTAARTLRLELRAGAGGPIQDRLVLKRMLILSQSAAKPDGNR